MTTYSSTYPPLPEIRTNVFNHVFRDSSIPDDHRSYVDALTHKYITRGEIKTNALRLAWSLRNMTKFGGAHDLYAGDILMHFSPNTLMYPVVILGAMAAGVVHGFSAAAQPPPELAHQMQLTKPMFFAIHPTLLPTFLAATKLLKMNPGEVKRRTFLMASREDLSPELLAEDWILYEDLIDHGEPFEVVNLDGGRSEASAAIFYSSGTTSLPKAVEASHYNVVSATDRIAVWGGIQGGRAVISVMPFYHVAGGVGTVLAALQVGCSIIMVTKYEMRSFLSATEKYRPTMLMVTGPIVSTFVTSPILLEYDIKSVERIMVGAAPTGVDLIEAAVDRMSKIASPDFGIYQAYGLTELTGVSHFTPLGRKDKPSSIGPLYANHEARLVDDDENDVPKGQAGELWIRGPTIMKGYLNAPEATAETLTKDGWLKSGDIAVIDEEGFYYIVDRKKELIKYNAWQVPPAELEGIIHAHPDVLDVGVIGVPSLDKTTELPRAYVVPHDPKKLTDPAFAKEIQEYVKGKVAYYKELRGGVRAIASIPRSGPGKILRRELRALAKAEEDAIKKAGERVQARL